MDCKKFVLQMLLLQRQRPFTLFANALSGTDFLAVIVEAVNLARADRAEYRSGQVFVLVGANGWFSPEEVETEVRGVLDALDLGSDEAELDAEFEEAHYKKPNSEKPETLLKISITAK